MRPIAGLTFLIVLARGTAALAQIPTFCGNNARTCSNTNETILKPSNLSQMVQLGSYPAAGQIYAQPLIATGVSTAGGKKDLLIVATMEGNLQAFDANLPGSAPVWSIHLNNPRTSFDQRGGEPFYNKPLGCMATPVVDTSYAYAVCAGPATNANATWTLYKVALSNGTLADSTVIGGSVSGTGSGGSTVTFSADQQIQRSALLLASGKVYIAFGSYADQDPWFGWIFAYDAATLDLAAITNASPNDKNVGFWMSGGGPAADASGNLYVMTGNTLTGIYNAPTDLTESFVKYDPSLHVLDYFTPSDHAARDKNDWDLGSSWPILAGNLVVGSGKRNSGYAILADNMGHLQGGSGIAPQVFTKAGAFTDCAGCGTFASAAYMNGRFYFANKGGFQGENKIFMFPLSGSTIAKTPVAAGATSFSCCGAQFFGSSNGASDGILWALTPDSSLFSAIGTGTLRAFDVSTLAEIYTGPSIGNMPKFMHPIVWNGRVYVATLDGSVLAFGIPSKSMHFSVSAPGAATAGVPFNFTVTAMDANNAAFAGYSGAIHFSSSDGAANLPGNATLNNGAGTFSATLNTAGVQTLTAADTANSSISGASGAIAVSSVSPGTPFAGSASPSAGNGAGQQITFTFSDTRGWQNLDVVNVLINNFLDGRNACYIAYSRPSGVLYLVGDAGGLSPGLVLGNAGNVRNSQCTINGAGSSVTGSGNTLTLVLNIDFAGGFAGNRVVYLAARNLQASNSGWQALGTWAIPGASTFPWVNGVDPARGSGLSRTFTFTFTDTSGFEDLGIVNILINDSLDGRRACYLAYSRPLGVLYLVNDQGAGLSNGLVLNGPWGSIGNGQCTVNSFGSAASGSGSTFSLTLNISFAPAFGGNRIIYVAARDANEVNNSGWQPMGSWTVQ